MRENSTPAKERLLIALLWASIPLLAIHFASVWSALPQRIPTHFDIAGRPNGWQSPASLALFAFLLLAVLVGVFSFAMLRAFRLQSMDWAVTILAYAIVGTNFTVFWQLLDHAAYGRPMSHIWPVPLVLPILGLLIAIVLMVRVPASSASPSGTAMLIAEEQHRSLLQLLFVAPGFAIGLWLASQPLGIARLLGILLAAAMAWIAVAMFDGFRYLIRSDGVQIRGFLLPLRFIPRASIQRYETKKWNGLGYGIRLTSTGTAYIWGGKNVVNIVTDSGDIMLGHAHPERLIQDLDRMMQTAKT